MSRKNFVILLFLVGSSAHATDYFSTLKDMFAASSTPAQYPRDLMKGMYTDCTYASSLKPTIAVPTYLGFCRASDQGSGPAFPRKSGAIPCAAYDVTPTAPDSYGFLGNSDYANDGEMSVANNALTVQVNGSVLSEMRLSGDFIVFHRNGDNGEFYGYCWNAAVE